MSRKKLVPAAVAVAGLLLMALLAAGCGSSGEDDSGGGSEGGSDHTIPIGMVWSLSGELAPYGQPGVDGAEMAISEINEAGGVTVGDQTYDLSLSVEDDRSDTQAAVAGAIKLIRDDQVKYLIGPLSSLTGPVAKIAAEQEAMQFNASTIASPLAGTEDYPYLFGTVLAPEGRCEVIAESIHTFYPTVSKVAVVGPNEESGQLNFPICEEKLIEAGFDTQTFPYPAGSTDLTTTMAKVANFDPDVISTGWSVGDAFTVFPAIEPAGIPSSVPFVLYGASYETGMEGIGGERSFVAIPFVESDFSVPSPTKAALAFKDRLEKFLNVDKLSSEEVAAEYFYGAIHQLAASMEAADSIDELPEITEQMNTINTPGIAGPTEFSENIIVAGADATLVENGEAKTVHIVPPSAKK